MKKTYTKRQIKEAIAYWEKQLKAGNYRKVNEAVEAADDDDFAKIADMMRNMGIPEDKIQLQLAELKKAKAAGEFPGLTGNKAHNALNGGNKVVLKGDEQYRGPSMGKYRMTLKKNGAVADTYEWECFLFDQTNSDGVGDALDQFAGNDPDFADLLDGEYEDEIRDVGILEDSWTDPDGVYELNISPGTVQWEEWPVGWHAPMDSVTLDDDQMQLLGRNA